MPHPLAGQTLPADQLPDVDAIRAAYADRVPDPENPAERVSFGTSGHRGRSLAGSFTASHVAAITQAVCEVRAAEGTSGPLVLGADTHALSGLAWETALEVLVGNGVDVVVEAGRGVTATPVVSHAILTRNAGRRDGLADGLLLTPSHNPPEDGGLKYNPPSGGPAPDATTRAVEARANALLAAGLAGVRRVPLAQALAAAHAADLGGAYVADLGAALDLDAVRASGLRLGADPLGGATLPLWGRIAETYGLDLTVVNDRLDPAFAFVPADHDGAIRMDCSSRFAMSGLVALADRFDVAMGSDPDGDRHGIVTPEGLMDPNHVLSVAIAYLFAHRPGWPAAAGVGKTLVSSRMIDRAAEATGRPLAEVPVGFKYFVDGLVSGALGFGGEESAGASFLRRDGRPWTTDKDGVLLGLLAAEIAAVTGESPAARYCALEAAHGAHHYARADAPASRAQKAVLKALAAADVPADTLAGEPVVAVRTDAPAGGAIGGVKVETASAWFAARPSGTEDVYKVYAESTVSAEHLARVQDEARALVSAAFERAGAA